MKVTKAKIILKQVYLMKHAFKKNKDKETNIIPDKNTKSTCRVL